MMMMMTIGSPGTLYDTYMYAKRRKQALTSDKIQSIYLDSVLWCGQMSEGGLYEVRSCIVYRQ